MSLLAAYSGPFEGLNISVPDTKIKPTECAALDKITFYEGLLSPTALADTDIISADGTAIRAVFSFTDVNNIARQGYITDTNVVDTTSLIPIVTALPATGLGFCNTVVFSNSLFFVNGSQYVLYWDGTTVNQATNLYGALYIFELASSVCIANTIEATGQYKQRVRWCVAGNVTQWDPMSFTGAGFEDLLETPDGIHGVINTSPVAYILRSNGISQMIPTGVGTSAFDFEHLWASKNGIGNIIDFISATFGPFGFVLAFDDIYLITASSYDKVGSKVKNQLYYDISQATLSYSWMESFLSVASQPYLRYRIGINSRVSGLVIWSYSTENNGWERESFQDRVLTGPGGMYGTTAGFLIGQSFLFPVQRFSDMKFVLDSEESYGSSIPYPATYTFKRESDSQDRSITVRQVKIRYRTFGNADYTPVPVTVSLDGMNGSATQTLDLADRTKSKAYYGGGLFGGIAGKYYNAYFTVPLTDLEYQVSITIQPALNNGIFSILISDVQVFGDVGKEVIR